MGSLVQVICDLSKQEDHPLAVINACVRMFLYNESTVANFRELSDLFKFFPALIGPETKKGEDGEDIVEDPQPCFDIILTFFQFVENTVNALEDASNSYSPQWVLEMLTEVNRVVANCIENIYKQSIETKTPALIDFLNRISYMLYKGFFDNFYREGDLNGSCQKQLFYNFDNMFPDLEVTKEIRTAFKEYLRVSIETRKYLLETYGSSWRATHNKLEKKAEFTAAAIARMEKKKEVEAEREARKETNITGHKYGSDKQKGKGKKRRMDEEI